MKTALLLISSALLLSACDGVKYTTRESTLKPPSETGTSKDSQTSKTENKVLKTEFFVTNSEAVPAYAVVTSTLSTQTFPVARVEDTHLILKETTWSLAKVDKEVSASAVPVSKRRFLQVLNNEADTAKKFRTTDDVCQVVLGSKCETQAVPVVVTAIPMQCSFTIEGKSYPLALSYDTGLAKGRKQMFLIQEQEDGSKVVKTFLDDRANFTAQLELMKELAVTKTAEAIENASNKTFWQKLFSNNMFVKMRAQKNLENFFGSFYYVDAMFVNETDGRLKLSSSKSEANASLDETELNVVQDAQINEYINYVRKDGSVGQTQLRAECLAL